MHGLRRLVVSRRLSSSVVVCRRLSSSSRLKFAAIEGSFCKGLFMDVSRASLRHYSIVICVTMTCRARNVVHFAAQAQRFVRSADCCTVPLGLGFGESCFWGVGCGRAIGICVSGCGIGFRDKSQLKWRFWLMGVCSERVEIIPNVWCGASFVGAHMK